MQHLFVARFFIHCARRAIFVGVDGVRPHHATVLQLLALAALSNPTSVLRTPGRHAPKHYLQGADPHSTNRVSLGIPRSPGFLFRIGQCGCLCVFFFVNLCAMTG